MTVPILIPNMNDLDAAFASTFPRHTPSGVIFADGTHRSGGRVGGRVGAMDPYRWI